MLFQHSIPGGGRTFLTVKTARATLLLSYLSFVLQNNQYYEYMRDLLTYLTVSQEGASIPSLVPSGFRVTDGNLQERLVRGERLSFSTVATYFTDLLYRGQVNGSGFEHGHGTPDVRKGFLRSKELFILSCLDNLTRLKDLELSDILVLYATYLSSVI